MIADGYALYQALGTVTTFLIAPCMGYFVAAYFNVLDMAYVSLVPPR